MTHSAVLLVTRILQNRNLLECSGVAKFREDDEGYVSWIEFPKHKIRMYEKADQKHGVIFRFEFYESKKPFFTVEDYLRNGSETVIYLKKSELLQAPKMNKIITDMNTVVQETINSINHIGRYLAGAA
jgi:hypothetical protein